jgi:hypothetical protein
VPEAQVVNPTSVYRSGGVVVIFDVLAMAPAERSPGRGSGERKPERSEAPSQCRPSCERERCLLASSPPSSSASAYRTMASLPSTRPVRTVMRHWPPSSWRGGLLLMLKTRSVCLSLPPFTVCSQRYGRTPLHLACREGHKVVVSLLLERGATVDALTTVCVSLPPSFHHLLTELSHSPPPCLSGGS